MQAAEQLNGSSVKARIAEPEKRLDEWRGRIRSARKRLNISQAALGDLLGKSQSTTQSWEAEGGTEPSLEDFVAIADALKIPVAELAFGEIAITPQDIERKDLTRCLFAVASVIERNGLVFSAKRRTELYIAIYDIFHAINDPTRLESEIERLLEIAKTERA